MFSLDFRDGRAIYEQIKDNFKNMIISGAMTVDEQIPSVREVATQLSINPNTIQRAYRELEQEGFIYTIKGKGSFVAPPEEYLDMSRAEGLEKELRRIILELLYMGRKADYIAELVKNILYGEIKR